MIRRVGLSSIVVSGTVLLGCVPQQTDYGHAAPSQALQTPPPPAEAQQAPHASAAAQAPAAPEKSPLALMPLNVPIREEWSSPRCPDLAVTFSGRSEPAHSVASDSASFQEARQYHEGDYYEVAECFCTKGGDLSDTTKAAADAVTAETAQQFADAAHMRIYSTSFVENGPIGKYSQIVAVPLTESPDVVTMRTYWRGQCSMRVETVSNPESKLRAGQFLGSLRATKVAQTQKAAAAPAPAALPGATDAAKPAPEATTPAAPVAPTALPGAVMNPAPPSPAADAPPKPAT
jgi:hypothetical protein